MFATMLPASLLSKGLEQLAAKHPAIADHLEKVGGAGGAIKGPPTIIETDEGPVEFGGGGRGGRRGGMWDGKLGQGMYAAYIAKRMWSMTMAPFMQGRW